jgi:hypothetical protein
MYPNPDIVLNVEKAIKKGLEFLSAKQLPSGEFASYRSTDALMKEDCVFDSSPFPTALIAYSLSFSNENIAVKIVDGCCKFLLTEMEKHGVWRYWTSKHPYHKSIPPDLDDIACVSSVLRQNNIPFPDNRKIILANGNSKGLFYTWIVPRLKLPASLQYLHIVTKEALKPVRLFYFWKLNESKPNDIDAVVNSNVLFYLGNRQETKPVIDYLVDIIKNNKEEGSDKWHLSPFNLHYFISKNYFAGITEFEIIREKSINKLLTTVFSASKKENNILETALASCALLNWNCASDKIYPYIQNILIHQDEDGSWPIFPLYYGGPKKYFGWGSQEITTAFCLEALVRYLKTIKSDSN